MERAWAPGARERSICIWDLKCTNGETLNKRLSLLVPRCNHTGNRTEVFYTALPTAWLRWKHYVNFRVLLPMPEITVFTTSTPVFLLHAGSLTCYPREPHSDGERDIKTLSLQRRTWRFRQVQRLPQQSGQTQALHTSLPLPGGADGEESACNDGDLGSIPGSGRCPEEGNGNPLQYFVWSIPRAWARKESNTTEWLTLPLPEATFACRVAGRGTSQNKDPKELNFDWRWLKGWQTAAYLWIIQTKTPVSL